MFEFLNGIGLKMEASYRYMRDEGEIEHTYDDVHATRRETSYIRLANLFG